ncbi:putative bifunctional diguanylate cyclase/phosphodiesterase [Inhella crocodyli]|uniref:Bifunctional diguanylate cyclase/phosphodiesterase n=1 Tax=Inhella crocodyli TaxID=2499851 RepID=A0A3S2V4I2_9BURK|nr:bifunctional diguanylate cyclase/phosphodiesterase [Inhella crocodyli]RVT88133.1 bifunctional diguanylate cyclase/phosphodiesterase [Inhella crocodyli]
MLKVTPLTPAAAVPTWSGGGFAGGWRFQPGSGLWTSDPDVAAALGLPLVCQLQDFLDAIDPADQAQVRSALEGAVSSGGRIQRRFKLLQGPAAGTWARLSGLAEGGVVTGALIDLPGEGQRMDSWRDAEQRFRHAFDQTPTTAVQGYDRQRRVIYWNAASEALYGWRREEALGRLLEELIIPVPMRAEVIRLHSAWVEHDQAIPAGELELQRKDGSPVPVFSSHVLLRNSWGEPEMYCIDVDLRQQRQAMTEGHRRAQQLQLVSQASHAGWWEWDPAEARLRWSSEIGRWFGAQNGGECSMDALRAVLDAGQGQQLDAVLSKVSAAPEGLDTELRYTSPEGDRHYLLHVEPSDPACPLRRMGTLLDITESKEAASRIDRLAHFDATTGLPNRLLMRERLAEALTRTPREGAKLVVGAIGLDHFRLVNESFGMAAGDALLNACAQRLQSRLRGKDLVVRLTGDQFGVLLDGLASEAETEAMANKLLGTFDQPFTLDEQEIFLTASLGLSVCPDDGDNAEALLQHAETALHRSKELGRGHHQFFRADMNQRSRERVQLINRLRRAQEGGELSLHYQPQMLLSSGQLKGAEALLRWQSPQFGSVPPDRFIPLAEDSGLIEPIGDWVLARCCETLRDWHAAGHTQLTLAANLSARQFRARNLVQKVAAEIERCAVPASSLVLEVTESVLLDRDGLTRDLLFGLKDLGLRLAIDDFGTGYSSLSYLRRFPVDILKIDRAFVRDLGKDADADALVRAIAGMARALKLTVVAEGVETAEQAALLKMLDCDYGQGWLFGKPQPAPDFARLFMA